MSPRLLLLLALLLPTRAAWAQLPAIQFGSSPNPVGSGARALGIGSSFIATADDATAASWNPGGLIALERPEASLVLSYKNRRERFSGIGVARGDELQSSSNGDINYFSLAYPFKLRSRSFVASLSFQSLIDFDKRVQKTYFATGGSLSSETKVDFLQEGSLRALAPAIAFQLSPYLALGATLTLWTDRLGYDNGWVQKEEVTYTRRVLSNVTTSALSIEERYSLDGIGANVGALWDVTPALTIGAVVKTPVWGTLTRTIERFEQDGAPVLQTPRSFEESVRLPPSYGLGVAYRHSDELTVSADVYRTEWGLFRQRVSDPSTGEHRYVNPINARRYRDANVSAITQVHVGAERLVVLERTVLPVRAGLFYDPEPGTRRANRFAGVALGTGVSIGDVIVDAVYQARFAFDADADNVVVEDPVGPVTVASAKGGGIWQHAFYLSTIFHM